MRIATYNVEWFDSLFDKAGNLLPDNAWSGRRDVQRGQQIAALGRVFRALDADAVMVIEAPDTNRDRNGVRALENFAHRFRLRAKKALIGFVSDTQQEIMLLYDPAVLTARHDPLGQDGPDAPRFDATFQKDIDIDATPELIRWSKPPLEVALTTAGGKALRLIGVHAKSKAPHGAHGAAQIMAIGIENRRKQLAQCVWLRARVAAHLAAGDDLIVLGDFNDGPGLDDFETLFGKSSIEIVMGEGADPALQLTDPHARMALTQRIGAAPTTARFKIPPDGRYLSALLDYVMVSPRLAALAPAWRIWHPFDDPLCYENPRLRNALLTASDHFPVSIDLAL